MSHPLPSLAVTWACEQMVWMETIWLSPPPTTGAYQAVCWLKYLTSELNLVGRNMPLRHYYISAVFISSGMNPPAHLRHDTVFLQSLDIRGLRPTPHLVGCLPPLCMRKPLVLVP